MACLVAVLIVASPATILAKAPCANDASCAKTEALAEEAGALDGSAPASRSSEEPTAEADADALNTGADAPDYCALVPELVQYPDMPAGCEVYSLTSVLRSLGFDADPHLMANEHLPFESADGTAAGAYSGSPYGDGEGLPPAIAAAGNSYLEEEGSEGSAFRFVDATGSTFEELLAEAQAGRPVLVWTTMYFSDPGFGAPLPAYTFYELEHCVVLLGENDDGTIRCMDPMSGYANVDAERFRMLYELCGSMAVTIG